jgi:hypothetical protein
MLTTAENGLQHILVEVMSAHAGAPAAQRDVAAQAGAPINYTPLEIAVLRLRWLGEQLSNRGGVALMRLTLDNAIRDHVANPWLRSLADIYWAGIGRWSARPAPLRGPMG